jgi:putative tributyrin esterase
MAAERCAPLCGEGPREIVMLMWLLLTTLMAAAPSEAGPSAVTGRWLDTMHAVGSIDGHEVIGEVRVYVPAGYGSGERFPLVIALHGWDHSPAQFQAHSELGALADKHRVVVAVPDTGRSIFETSFYPQSKSRWRLAPGARLVGEVVLPWLRQNLDVKNDKAHTAIIGYSTGGRGACVLAQRYPEFAYVGSVSGTYDLMALSPKTGEYRIHKAIYGERNRFPERWDKDNVMARDELGKLSGLHLYVAHGDKDKVVPMSQLRLFEQALKGVELGSRVFVVTPGGGHDWELWNAHWPAMFEGFERSMRH